MKKFLIIFILFFFQPHIYAQKKGKEKIDSLFSILSTAPNDTIKVNTLNELSLELRYTNLDTAIYLALRSLELATRRGYSLGIADAKSKIGALYASKGKYEEGVRSCKEAILLYEPLLSAAKIKRTIENKIGDAYFELGHNLIQQGNYPEALKNSFLALKLKEKLGNKRGIGDAEFNIGNIYVLLFNYPEALKHHLIALKISEEFGIKTEIAICHTTIGFIYSELGNNAEASKHNSIAIKLAEETKDKITLAEIYYNNLGVVSDKQGNYNEALQYYFVALKLYKEVGINEQIPFVYNSIALVYLKQKKYNEASKHLHMALLVSKEFGNLEGTRLSYQNRAMLDSAQGNFKNSLVHYKLFITTRDSLYNEANTKKLVEQQMQYDFDKKESLTKAEQEKKDAVAKKELQRQKIVRNGFMGGFAIVLLFAGVFFAQRNKIKKGKKLSDELLLNILPEEVAEELKAKGSTEARQFDDVTVMFTDFKNFTQISEKLSPSELVAEIHYCFKAFDNITSKHNIEKIKTIGDSYMCAGGLPVANTTNAIDVVSAAMEMQQFMQAYLQQRAIENKELFEIRIGIHTGPVVAGIVGVKKFAYDIWGDTVNIASRMESSGEPGKVNISGRTYKLVKDKFQCFYRGKIYAKNKGEIDMYFVESVLV